MQDARVAFPTFVMLNDGRETGRIEGYPGDEFFWPLLNELIDTATLAQPPQQENQP